MRIEKNQQAFAGSDRINRSPYRIKQTGSAQCGIILSYRRDVACARRNRERAPLRTRFDFEGSPLIRGAGARWRDGHARAPQGPFGPRVAFKTPGTT